MTTPFFRLRELEGPGEASLFLTGPASALAGPELVTEARGGSHTPIGSSEATLTVSSLIRKETEFSFSWSAGNLEPGNVVAEGLDVVARPESLFDAFEVLAERGRLCLVTLPGGLARRGVVRKVSGKPLRGYGTDPATGDPLDGVDLECSITIDWAGRGESPPATASASDTGEDLAGDLGDSLDTLASAAADGDPFAPGFLEQIDNAVTNVVALGTNLRTTMRGIGALAQAPATIALSITSAARSFGNALSDFDALMSDTPEIYQAAGLSMAELTKGRNATGRVKGGGFDAMAVLAAIFAAIDARSPRTVSVRPGQSLADVAAAELGDRNRWPELSEHNSIAGQLVPDGVFSIEVPGASG